MGKKPPFPAEVAVDLVDLTDKNELSETRFLPIFFHFTDTESTLYLDSVGSWSYQYSSW